MSCWSCQSTDDRSVQGHGIWAGCGLPLLSARFHYYLIFETLHSRNLHFTPLNWKTNNHLQQSQPSRECPPSPILPPIGHCVSQNRVDILLTFCRLSQHDQRHYRPGVAQSATWWMLRRDSGFRWARKRAPEGHCSAQNRFSAVTPKTMPLIRRRRSTWSSHNFDFDTFIWHHHVTWRVWPAGWNRGRRRRRRIGPQSRHSSSESQLRPYSLGIINHGDDDRVLLHWLGVSFCNGSHHAGLNCTKLHNVQKCRETPSETVSEICLALIYRLTPKPLSKRCDSQLGSTSSIILFPFKADMIAIFS